MARSEARIAIAIWQDQDFIALPVEAQRMYLFLLSQPDLSSCGVLSLRPRRWANSAPDLTEEAVLKTLRLLEQAGLTLADEETQELYVTGSTGGVILGPKRMVAVWRAIQDVASPKIQAASVAEFTEMGDPTPNALRAKILLRDGYRCRSCDWSPGDSSPLLIEYRGLEIDHVQPRIKGGRTVESNLQVLCSTCNIRKGAAAG